MNERTPARDRFKLVDEDNGTPAQRGGWRRLGVWVGPVCAVVVVTPPSWLESEEDAKRALYRYLRRVSQTLLEFGHVLPLAAIVAAAGERAAAPFRGWGADQGWHRGAFALYVTNDNNLQSKEDASCAAAKKFDPNRLLDRLEDLLDPVVDAFIAEAPAGKSLDGYIEDVERLGRMDGASQELTELSMLVVHKLRGASGHSAPATDPVKDWAGNVVRNAQKIAQGEAV